MGGRDDLLRGQPAALLDGGGAADRRGAAPAGRAVRGVRQRAAGARSCATSEELGLTHAAAARRRGPVVLRRGGAPHRRARDQGGSGRRPGRRAATWSASTSTSICSTRARATPQQRRPARRHGRDVRLERCSRARRSKVPLILSGGLDAGQRAPRRSRVARPYAVDTASGTERCTRTQGPGAAAGVLRAPSACRPREPTLGRLQPRRRRRERRRRDARSSTASAPTAASTCPRR